MSENDNESVVDANTERNTPIVKSEEEKIAGVNRAESDVKGSNSSSSDSIDHRYHDCRIYVSNIPFSFRSRDLIDMFSPYGIVSNAEIVMNERGSKGFGFVTLDTKQGSEAARSALNGTVVNGRVIEVKKATTMSSRRNGNRPQQFPILGPNIILPPSIDSLIPKQLTQIQPQPYGHPSPAGQLDALLFAQNQLSLQPMLNPMAHSSVPYSTLFVPRQLPPLQQPTLVASGIPLSPIGIPSIPLQFLCAPSNAVNAPTSSNSFTNTVIPFSTGGLSYTSIPYINQGSLLQSAMSCRLAQDVSRNSTGYMDLLGSLGYGGAIAPSLSHAMSNNMTENGLTQNLRSLDQSCVIDTSLHGEPLKEGHYGPIGSAVPPGNVNQSSSNSDFLAQTSASLDVHAFGCSFGNESLETIPVYHQFEQADDRNGRKRLSTTDECHTNRKLAKPG